MTRGPRDLPHNLPSVSARRPHRSGSQPRSAQQALAARINDVVAPREG